MSGERPERNRLAIAVGQVWQERGHDRPPFKIVGFDDTWTMVWVESTTGKPRPRKVRIDRLHRKYRLVDSGRPTPGYDFVLDWRGNLPVYAYTAMLYGLGLVYPDAKWVTLEGDTGRGMAIQLGDMVEVPDDFWDDMANYAKELLGDEGR